MCGATWPKSVPAWVLDAAVGVVISAAALLSAIAKIGPATGGTAGPDALAYALAVVSAGGLAVRRARPGWALALTDLAAAGWILAGYHGRVITASGLIACYTVAAYRGLRWAATAAVANVALSLAVASQILPGQSRFGDVSLSAASLNIAAAAIGVAVGRHRRYVAAMRERLALVVAGQAARERERVAQERVRIARELHDVVAHGIATVNLQAGVAAHLIDRDPDRAAQALRTIKQTSGEAMRELRAILGVLRTDHDAADPREPAPGLDQLPRLVTTVRAAGLAVDYLPADSAEKIPTATGLTVYRIVQESLTNVLRHANARRATVRVDHAGAQVVVEVLDDGRGGGEVVAGGHGIAGMRERVAAHGGTLTAGPGPAGGFLVRATLQPTTPPPTGQQPATLRPGTAAP